MPHPYGRLTCLHSSLEEMGDCHVYRGNPYFIWYFESKSRQIHCADPAARFVLAGYSMGACAAHTVAEDVGHDGICIDLLIYLDAVPMTDGCRCLPGNIKRVLNLVGGSSLLHGQSIAGAELPPRDGPLQHLRLSRDLGHSGEWIDRPVRAMIKRTCCT